MFGTIIIDFQTNAKLLMLAHYLLKISSFLDHYTKKVICKGKRKTGVNYTYNVPSFSVSGFKLVEIDPVEK